MAVNDEQLKSALDHLDSVQDDPALFVASNGTRIKLKRVSQMIMLDAARRLVAPKPPKTWVEEKSREAENPLDPDYLIAMRNHNYDTGQLAVSTYFILGTTVTTLGEDVSPLESEEWVEQMLAIDPNADIPAKGPRRYLAWLKYHVLSDTDANELLEKCIRYGGGTLEADVRNAQATFRREQARNTSERVLPSAGESGLGDQHGDAPGDGGGLRSAGSGSLSPVPVGQVDRPPEF